MYKKYDTKIMWQICLIFSQVPLFCIAVSSGAGFIGLW